MNNQQHGADEELTEPPSPAMFSAANRPNWPSEKEHTMLEKQGIVAIVDGGTLITASERFERFDIKDYIDHPPMITKLYTERHEAVSNCIKLQEQVSSLQSQLNSAKGQVERFEDEADEAKKKSHFVFVLTLLATVLVGIGVNVATTTPHDSSGWVMIVAACILEFVAFFLGTKK